MADLKRICVYCGARAGNHPAYRAGAVALGELLAHEQISLVYGGSKVGLMNEIASIVMHHGGEVIGILPHTFRHQEPEHNTITSLHIVENIHQRKAMMEQYADGFIAMPGGVGTFDELFEMICWSYAGLHKKPIGLLNINGYFEPIMGLLHHAIDEGFTAPRVLDAVYLAENPAELLDMMRAYSPA